MQINMDVASLTPQLPGSPGPAADFMFRCVVKDQRSTAATITIPALAARSVRGVCSDRHRPDRDDHVASRSHHGNRSGCRSFESIRRNRTQQIRFMVDRIAEHALAGRRCFRVLLASVDPIAKEAGKDHQAGARHLELPRPLHGNARHHSQRPFGHLVQLILHRSPLIHQLNVFLQEFRLLLQ